MSRANTIRNTQLDIEYQLPDGVILNAGTTASYIDILKAVDKLPFSKVDIKFSDGVWDFSRTTNLNIPRNSLKFYFHHKLQGSCFVDTVKVYVLLSILKNQIKVQTLQSRFYTVADFLMFVESRHVYHVEDISENDMKDFLCMTERDAEAKGSNVPEKIRKTKLDIKHFFDVYSANFDSKINTVLYKYVDVSDDKGRKARQEQNRFKGIPEDYFDKLLSALITVSNDETAPLDIRGTACAYIILSQTGLRAGEILDLRIDALHVSPIFNGETAEYLYYRTWKRKHSNNVADTVFTYINKLSLNAFNLLLELHKAKRTEFGLDYLYMGGRLATKKKFPLSTMDFETDAKELFTYLDNHNLLKAADLPKDTWTGLKVYNTKKNWLLKVDQDGEKHKIMTLTFPHTQQFRYHVCSELARRGVPIEYIRVFMAHLTVEMTKSHYNPQPKIQEDMEYSKKVLKEIVTDEARPLSGDKGMTQKIREFIEENHYNVEKDLDTIVDKLAGKMPIRRKAGGCCIKSSQLRECSKDAQTNEFYCAYGVCPNIVHFYYTADVSYKLCRELLETIEINTKNGFRKQVQKERNMLNYIVVKRLQPEIEDLKRVIERDGVEHVYMMHPELKAIVENLESIEKEMTEWTTPQS